MIKVETIIVGFLLTLLMMMITSPIWIPIKEEREAEKIQDILKNGKAIEVSVQEKDVVAKEIHERFGNRYVNTKYFVFFDKDIEYFVSPSNDRFFNRVRKGGNIKVYFYKGKMLGVTSDGTRAYLVSM